MSFFFLFICEKLSLGSDWSGVKRLWACEHKNSPPSPKKKQGYACIWGIHRFTLSKFWGRFSQLLVFYKIRFIENSRTQSVFMLQRCLANQNIAERIRKKTQLWIFHFQHFFCNMNLKSNICRKKWTSVFSIRRLVKNNSHLSKKQSWVSLPWSFSIILIGELYLIDFYYF